MTKTIFIIFSILTLLSLYATYQGIGLQGVSTEEKSTRSYSSGHSSSSGGYSFGK